MLKIILNPIHKEINYKAMDEAFQIALDLNEKFYPYRTYGGYLKTKGIFVIEVAGMIRAGMALPDVQNKLLEGKDYYDPLQQVAEL